MDENTLMRILENVEFCDIESGRYFRAVSVATESSGTVVMIEEAPNE